MYVGRCNRCDVRHAHAGRETQKGMGGQTATPLRSKVVLVGGDYNGGDASERSRFPGLGSRAVLTEVAPFGCRKAYRDGDGVPHMGRGTVSTPCSTQGCERTSDGTFPFTPLHPPTFAPPSTSASTSTTGVPPSSPSSPCSHLTGSTPASHCELNDDGAGEPLPAESESGGEGDAEPVLWVLSPRDRLVNTLVLGDGVRACTVVIECECAW